MIPRILVLTSELVEEPDPIVGLVEPICVFQLAQPACDELLGIERHGVTWVTFSQPGITQHSDAFRIKKKEVDPPTVWTDALNMVEERPVSGVEQVLAETETMAADVDHLGPWRSPATGSAVRVNGLYQMRSKGSRTEGCGRWRSCSTGWRQGSAGRS